jgi:hypothetical protein
MAYILGTGFETGSADQLPLRDAQGNGIQSSRVHSGSFAAYVAESFGARYIGWPLPSTYSEVWLGLWFYHYDTNGGQPGLRIQFNLGDGNTVFVRSNYANNHLLTISTGGTLRATGSLPVSYKTWYNLQIHVKIAESPNGLIEVKLDGNSDVSYSGDTQPGASDQIGTVYVYGEYNSNGETDFDDLVVSDSAWTDDVRFEALVPTADTAQKDWTRSTGADNYALVDERPPSDADYVITSANAAKDYYDITDYDATNKTPLFVVQWARAKKNTANSQKLKLALKSGSTEDISSAYTLTTTFAYYSRLLTLDPLGASWSDAVLDSLKLGQVSEI